MEILKFKTSIQCGGCVATVTPVLNKAAGIGHWKVDTQHPNKILTVESDTLPAGGIIAVLKSAGYRAEQI
jgi:copper chaperone